MKQLPPLVVSAIAGIGFVIAFFVGLYGIGLLVAASLEGLSGIFMAMLVGSLLPAIGMIAGCVVAYTILRHANVEQSFSISAISGAVILLVFSAASGYFGEIMLIPLALLTVVIFVLVQKIIEMNQFAPGVLRAVASVVLVVSMIAGPFITTTLSNLAYAEKNSPEAKEEVARGSLAFEPLEPVGLSSETRVTKEIRAGGSKYSAYANRSYVDIKVSDDNDALTILETEKFPSYHEYVSVPGKCRLAELSSAVSAKGTYADENAPEPDIGDVPQSACKKVATTNKGVDIYSETIPFTSTPGYDSTYFLADIDGTVIVMSNRSKTDAVEVDIAKLVRVVESLQPADQASFDYR